MKGVSSQCEVTYNGEGARNDRSVREVQPQCPVDHAAPRALCSGLVESRKIVVSLVPGSVSLVLVFLRSSCLYVFTSLRPYDLCLPTDCGGRVIMVHFRVRVYPSSGAISSAYSRAIQLARGR